MDKHYQPENIENKWYTTWEQNHLFAPQGDGPAYCIMMPPPNITGSLHMGHGFGSTLMDILIRYHRMKGDNTLWQPGTDHAGIATQMVVERQLMMHGTTRHDLGRDAFIDKIWEWKSISGNQITQQFRRLGASPDWQREHFTLDESLSYAVRHVFIQLYEEGLIYRGTRLVNWDPKLLTAISDLEVINREEQGSLWYIRYPFTDHDGHITVATTRPETLFGDVAIAVHPDDERYQDKIGQTVQLPLTDRCIPIIADDSVDPVFGTGCVKITPAHDFNDYAMGQRHHLTPITIFTPTAHLNQNVPSAYQGLERFKAREQVLNDLTVLGLIEKIEKHTLNVPYGDVSGVVIEPYLTPQWFLKIKPLAEPAIQAVENGDIRFIPEQWSKTYFQWMHNIEDWCISRQLWWGHRIPIWYDEDSRCYVGHTEEDVRQRYQLPETVALQQETDVLDTWFSSALWPFSSLGWPENTKEFQTFYPTQVLITGFDIIFFWVARMIMMGLKFTGQVPFRDVFITGLIRDNDGHKMSKSKGNVLDPIDLIDGISLEALLKKRVTGLMQPAMAQKIEKATRQQFPNGIAAYGTDALRFTYCALASHGRDIRFDLNRLEGYRHFCNKLWNAARYVLMQVGEPSLQSTQKISDRSHLSLPDRWILSRLQQTIDAAHTTIQDYRFDLLAKALYEFVWNEFCDWYLELSKPLLSSPDSRESQQPTQQTLVTVLETILRLLHPIMPYITEEIWQRVAPLANISGKTILLQPYPETDSTWIDMDAENTCQWVKNIVIAIRTMRSDLQIPPSKWISIVFHKGNTEDHRLFKEQSPFIQSLARCESMTWLPNDESLPQSAVSYVGDLTILLPLAGIRNQVEEKNRIQKDLEKHQKELFSVEAKLANPQFIDRAPAAVVEKEKTKRDELIKLITQLTQSLTTFE